MNIDVTKDEVIIDKNSDKAHENEYRITECEFVFDVFTNSFQVKRAIFTILSTGEMYEVDIINNKCNIPSEVLKHAYETVKLGVYGYNIGENDELLNRFSPSYAEFVVPTGSYEEGAQSPEEITPSQYDLYSQALQEGLQEVDDKLDEVVETVDGKIGEVDTKLGEVDSKLDEVDGKIQDVDTAISNTNDAIERTNNLNLDVSDKVDGDVTVTLTKKDASTKTVVISDGTSLQFMWQGTSLGIKTDDMEDYVFVDLQGIQGIKGDTGEPFTIKKTYSSVAEMNADFNNMEYGDYVMIASSVEVEDNAKLYTRGESQWIFITDFSGATGIRGPVGATPNIQIGSVTSGSTPSVTRTGADENPILNFVLQPGPQGEVGPTGLTGNGISSITKTGTSGLVDTYTITFTNGNTTTFDVTNGKGIDRIEKTATVGNIDTYTIYFNDNSTSTFEVANGEVTREELEEEVDRLSMIYNLFPTTSDEDTEMTLDGTGEVKLKKIGLKGNTYQESTTGKNLLIFPYSTSSRTEKGVTWTVNSDGSITVNGTASGGDSLFNLYYSNTTNLVNDTENQYTFYIGVSSTATNVRRVSGEYINGQMSYYPNSNANIGTVFTTSSNASGQLFRLSVADGMKADNVTIYPMIVEGNYSTIQTSYEPYTGGQPSPNPDYPQDVQVVSGDNTIKVEGKNLFDKDSASLVQKGITSTTGVISGDNNKRLENDNLILLQAGTYTISNAICDNMWVWAYDLNQNYLYQKIMLNWYTGNSYTFTINEDLYIRFLWRKSNDSEININDNFNIQLEKSNQATTYTPYVSQSYPISLGVENLINPALFTTTGSYNVASVNNGEVISSSITGYAGVRIALGQNINLKTNDEIYVRLKLKSDVAGDVFNTIQLFNSSNAGITSTEVKLSTPTLTTEYQEYIIKYTIGTDETLNKLFIQHKGSSSNVFIIKDIQISYKNGSYTSYGTTPIELCKIGDYKDRIYKRNNKWYLEKNIGNHTINSNDNVSQGATSTDGYVRCGWGLHQEIAQADFTKKLVVCNKFLGVPQNDNTNSLTGQHWYCSASNTDGFKIMFRSGDITFTKTQFQEFLKNNNIIVYYLLNTPTTTEITDTTLIEQLDNLENAYSYDTQTNIIQTNDDMPFILDVEALMSLKGVLN